MYCERPVAYYTRSAAGCSTGFRAPTKSVEQSTAFGLTSSTRKSGRFIRTTHNAWPKELQSHRKRKTANFRLWNRKKHVIIMMSALSIYTVLMRTNSPKQPGCLQLIFFTCRGTHPLASTLLVYKILPQSKARTNSITRGQSSVKLALCNLVMLKLALALYLLSSPAVSFGILSHRLEDNLTFLLLHIHLLYLHLGFPVIGHVLPTGLLLKGQCHDIQWFFALFCASKKWRLLAQVSRTSIWKLGRPRWLAAWPPTHVVYI